MEQAYTEHWRRLARGAFDAAVAAGHPGRATRRAMARLDAGPTAVLAIGKAAPAMAAAVREAGCDAPGIVVTSRESHAEIDGLRCLVGGHPLPDADGCAAAREVERLVGALGAGDHLLLLLSGGASAILPAPCDAVSLAQKRRLNEALLASGLDIHQVNAVRRLFSRLKGGRMARLAAPARVTQFVLSDVPGDRLESIASGPVVADPAPFSEVRDMIEHCGLSRLDFVAARLAALDAGAGDMPLRPGHAAFERVATHLLASNGLCRDAAADFMRCEIAGTGAGKGAVRKGDVGNADIAGAGAGGVDVQEVELPPLDGEADLCARRLAALMAGSVRAPGAVRWGVTGGECVVTFGTDADGGAKTEKKAGAHATPHGRGGRAQQMGVAYAAAMNAMDNAPAQWVALVAGTDGRDGPTDAAGALVRSHDAFDAQAAASALANHDCYHYLGPRDGLLKVPPTGTNLGDIAVLVAARPRDGAMPAGGGID